MLAPKAFDVERPGSICLLDTVRFCLGAKAEFVRPTEGTSVCDLYSITTNQAAIIALFRVVNRYVGNLAPMPGAFPAWLPSSDRAQRADGRELAESLAALTPQQATPGAHLFGP